MSVPPSAAFQPLGKVPDLRRLAAHWPRQLINSWYILYFQLPWLPERSASWVVPRLWRRWSPGYQADEDLRYVNSAIGAPERWRAALAYYRAMIRGSRPPSQYAELHKHWLSAPRLPTLYLHGTDDGCSEDYTPWIERVLPDGSETVLVERAGHFLQLEQPEVVARHIVDFIGKAA
jgi:pimeloyl-ACP methyl ester carboxylesterase